MKFVERYNIWVTESGEVFSKDKSRQYKPQISRTGYSSIFLNDNVRSKRTSAGVHRLVALAYIPNDEGKAEVNHKDGNKANNHVSNLEWVTKRENHLHANHTGLMDSRLVKIRKITRHRALVDLLEMGRSRQFVADAFGITPTAVSLALKNNKHFLDIYEKEQGNNSYVAEEI